MTDPIVIAGAGPCGSVLALSLARQNIPVILLEKYPELPRDLRASTFHPPTLEMLDDLGVAEAMIHQGLVADRYQYRDRRTGEVADFRMELIREDTRFPFRLQLEQYEMTNIVNAGLANYPHAEVRFDHEVIDVEQDAKGVTVEITRPGGIETLRAPFVIGCDGAGSNVRKAAGIGKVKGKEAVPPDVVAALKRLIVDGPVLPEAERLAANGINGMPYALKRPGVEMPRQTPLRWVIGEGDDTMLHPIHLHGCQFRIVRHNGKAPQPHLAGWKDTVPIFAGGETEILVTFPFAAPPAAPYMAHCHILEHEDSGMMTQFSVA